MFVKFNPHNENTDKSTHTHKCLQNLIRMLYSIISHQISTSSLHLACPSSQYPQCTILHWHMSTTWSSRSFLSIVIWQLELGHGIILQLQISRWLCKNIRHILEKNLKHYVGFEIKIFQILRSWWGELTWPIICSLLFTSFCFPLFILI